MIIPQIVSTTFYVQINDSIHHPSFISLHDLSDAPPRPYPRAPIVLFVSHPGIQLLLLRSGAAGAEGVQATGEARGDDEGVLRRSCRG